jgi:hypothetical protein
MRKVEPHEFTTEVPTIFAKTMHALVTKKGMTKAAIAKEVHWAEYTLTDVTRWIDPPVEPQRVSTQPPAHLSLVKATRVAGR